MVSSHQAPLLTISSWIIITDPSDLSFHIHHVQRLHLIGYKFPSSNSLRRFVGAFPSSLNVSLTNVTWDEETVRLNEPYTYNILDSPFSANVEMSVSVSWPLVLDRTTTQSCQTPHHNLDKQGMLVPQCVPKYQ